MLKLPLKSGRAALPSTVSRCPSLRQPTRNVSSVSSCITQRRAVLTAASATVNRSCSTSKSCAVQHDGKCLFATTATTTLASPVRGYHVSPVQHQQSSHKQPPPSSPSPNTTPSPSSDLPSLEPVLKELRMIITRRYPLGELYRTLSPETRKILIAHKLPLEELLLHLPSNFVVWRSRLSTGRRSTMSVPTSLMVAPPHLLLPHTQQLRLPPNTKPPPALAKLLGTTPAVEPRTASAADAAGSPTSFSTGTGFVDRNSTPLDRLQEVLTYIPNEFVPFSDLNISQDVKMRCMGYPAVRAMSFFMKYPKYFDVRTQHHSSHTFEVRRSLALQQQLKAAAPRQQ